MRPHRRLPYHKGGSRPATEWHDLLRIAHQDRLLGDSLAWIMAPQVATTAAQIEHGEREFLPGLMNTLRALWYRSGPTIHRVGDICLVSSSVQHDRVLDPVFNALRAGTHDRDVTPALPRISVRTTRRNRERAHDYVRSLESGLPGGFPEEVRALLVNQAHRAGDLRDRATRYFSAALPRVLLVATQHGAALRAVLLAAHDSEMIRTVYLPHAPTAANFWYRDLPTHHALLRGTAEVEYYEELGASSDRLHVCGNPSIPSLALANVTRSGALVVAPSLIDRTEFEHLSEVVGSGRHLPVVFSPHPRQRPQDIEQWPMRPGWSVTTTRTTEEYLSTMPVSALIPMGSGVGLDALGMGVPVIMTTPRYEGGYLYLATDHMEWLEGGSLEALLDGLDYSDAACRARRADAERWVAATGSDAVRRCIEAVEKIAESPRPADVIFDAWR